MSVIYISIWRQVSLSALCRGCAEEAVGYTLRAFDRDGDGGLCKAELATLLRAAYTRCATVAALAALDAESYAESLLDELDVDAADEKPGKRTVTPTQLAYLVRTEPVLHVWLPLEDAEA